MCHETHLSGLLLSQTIKPCLQSCSAKTAAGDPQASHLQFEVSLYAALQSWWDKGLDWSMGRSLRCRGLKCFYFNPCHEVPLLRSVFARTTSSMTSSSPADVTYSSNNQVMSTQAPRQYMTKTSGSINSSASVSLPVAEGSTRTAVLIPSLSLVAIIRAVAQKVCLDPATPPFGETDARSKGKPPTPTTPSTQPSHKPHGPCPFELRMLAPTRRQLRQTLPFWSSCRKAVTPGG